MNGALSARTMRAVVLVLLLLVTSVTWAPRAQAAQITYTYEVKGWGNSTSLEAFAAAAAETYANNAGWNLGGSISFVRVASGGSFTLWLSAPQNVPRFSSDCSSEYSCRVGRNVIINEARFRGGSAAWNATGASLRDYQHMVVNHETGHWLGFGHSSCPAAGRPAPLMQQQSKFMNGCRPNPWPTAGERQTLSRWKGVPIIQPPPPPPPPPPGPPLVQAQAFVRTAYRDVLGREADPAGLNSWAMAVHTGAVSRQSLMTALIRSQENTQHSTADLYQTVLGRDPDPGGLAMWSGALSNGAGFTRVRGAFWSSDERLARSGSLDQWIADIYLGELGRPVEPAGLADWTSVASSGGRQQVVNGVLGSTEWSVRTTASLYRQMLHRDADPAGLGGWAAILTATDTSTVQAALGSSQEYFDRAVANG